jgi:hypothetical protein
MYFPEISEATVSHRDLRTGPLRTEGHYLIFALPRPL